MLEVRQLPVFSNSSSQSIEAAARRGEATKMWRRLLFSGVRRAGLTRSAGIWPEGFDSRLGLSSQSFHPLDNITYAFVEIYVQYRSPACRPVSFHVGRASNPQWQWMQWSITGGSLLAMSEPPLRRKHVSSHVYQMFEILWLGQQMKGLA